LKIFANENIAGSIIRTLRERGLNSVEDISDALHFLTNIGELSYFGNVFP